MALGGSDIIVVCILAFVGLLLGSIFVYIFFYAGRRRRLEVECEPMLQDLPEPQLLSHSSPPSTVNLDAARKLVCADSAPISTLSTTRPPTETLSDLHRLPSSSFAVGVSHSPSGSDIPQLLVGRSERRHSTTAPPPLTRSRLRVVNDVESAAINVSRKKDKPDEPRRTMMSASKKAAVPAGKGQRRPRSRPSYVANASVFDLDDVMSSQTTSTLPPSYRSRRSTINPAFNLRYLLSTSHQTGRVPRGAATPLSSGAVDNSAPATEVLTRQDGNGSRNGTGRERANGIRRSVDGGVRLDGGHLDLTVAHPVSPRDHLVAVVEQLPPYMHHDDNMTAGSEQR